MSSTYLELRWLTVLGYGQWCPSVVSAGTDMRGTIWRDGGRGMSGAALCDCCGASIAREDGFLLPTVAIVASVAFWETQFTLAKKVVDLAGLDERQQSSWLSSSLRVHAGSRTPWLICDDCVAFFVTDYGEARSCARRGVDPPKLGAVDPSKCALFAAIAWESVMGRWPAIVMQPEVGNHCDFCGRRIYRGEVASRFPRETVQLFRAAGALDGDPLSLERKGEDGWMTCMKCTTSMGTKMLRAEGRL